MSFTILSSTKNTSLLAYNGHQYLKKRVNGDGSIIWRCKKINKYRCNAILKMHGEDVIRETGSHTHSGDALEVQKNAVITKIRAAAQTGVPTRSMIGEAASGCQNELLASLPKRGCLSMLFLEFFRVLKQSALVIFDYS